jgi:hypothetical protein
MNEQAKVTSSPDPWARRRRLRTPMITVVELSSRELVGINFYGDFRSIALPSTCISLVRRKTIPLHRNSGV